MPVLHGLMVRMVVVHGYGSLIRAGIQEASSGDEFFTRHPEATHCLRARGSDRFRLHSRVRWLNDGDSETTARVISEPELSPGNTGERAGCVALREET